MKYKKLVLGIDQSYTRTGLSLAGDGKLLKVASLGFKGCKNKTEKRNALRDALTNIIKCNICKADEFVVLCERIRTFSHGVETEEVPVSKASPKMFISTNYIKSTGALTAVIVDTVYSFGIPVFSVDTRSWKAQVVGSSKGSKKDGNKWETVKFVARLGFDKSSVNRKGVTVFDDDACDSACIALYGFIPESRQTLKQEQ